MSKVILYPSGGNDTSAILASQVFSEVEFTPGIYRFEDQFNISAGQRIVLNNVLIYHTDNTKRMFVANQVDSWSIVGNGLLQGTLINSGPSTGEMGVNVIGCNKYLISGLNTRAFYGWGSRIDPGTFFGFKADQGQWIGGYDNESLIGMEIVVGSGAEYNLITNRSAIGNVLGVRVGAGNSVFLGGNVVENNTGISLVGGSNNGHGSFNGTNINHNSTANIVLDSVTNGFDFTGCHVYGNGTGTCPIHFLNTTTDVAFLGGRIDCPVVHDASGTNRVFNSKLYSTYAVSGSNTAGWIASGCY